MAKSTSTIVLITGANQGIGFSIARKLTAENPGYHVLLGARDPKKGEDAASKLQGEGLSVEALTIDVSSDRSIFDAFQEVSSKYGRLDVLINNAGISRAKPHSSLREEMQELYNTNAFGAAQVMETFVPLLEKSSLPRVIFMSSILGSSRYPGEPDKWLSYKTSKAAMNKICQFYAQKFSEKKWKINACCPGYIGTNLNNYAGTGTVEEGAVNASRLATLGEDGETGTYSNRQGPIEW
jgi:NAD(P)-dependent dehydrogenase (short-subunit alcohol dehydrogenase family)